MLAGSAAAVLAERDSTQMTALAVLLRGHPGLRGSELDEVQLLRGHPLSPHLTRALAGTLPAGLAATIVARHSRRTATSHRRGSSRSSPRSSPRFTNQVLLVVAAGMAAFWLLTLSAS